MPLPGSEGETRQLIRRLPRDNKQGKKQKQQRDALQADTGEHQLVAVALVEVTTLRHGHDA